MEKLHIEEVDSYQFSSSSDDDVPLYLRLLLTDPSISKSGIHVHGPEQVVFLNEVHIYEVSIFLGLMYSYQHFVEVLYEL